MNPKTRSLVKEQFIDICNSTANAYGCTAKVEINEGYPVTINTLMESDIAIEVAKKVVKTKAVKDNLAPSMGAEDFAYMLEKKPGAYIWLGAGEGKSGCMLHNSKYDFNDEIIPLGISYWYNLVENQLSVES